VEKSKNNLPVQFTVFPKQRETGPGPAGIISIACQFVFLCACETTVVCAADAVTILGQVHSLNVSASSAKGYEIHHFDIKGRTLESDPVAGTSIETTFHNPNPDSENTEEQAKHGNNPVSAGDDFSFSLKANVQGGASAVAELVSVAGYDDDGKDFNIFGSISVSADTKTGPGWGAMAKADAELSVFVKVVGPSFVYVHHCDQVEIGMVADDDIVRYDDICRIRTVGGAVDAEDFSMLTDILSQAGGGALSTELNNANLIPGTAMLFTIRAESFKSSEITTPEIDQNINIGIRPGCTIAIREPAKSTIGNMVMTEINAEIPEVTIYEQTDLVRGLREKEVELGQSEYADDEFRKQATKIADDLANPIQAHLILTFPVVGQMHTVTMTSEYGSGSLSLDLDKGSSMNDIDAFLERVIAAIRVHVDNC